MHKFSTAATKSSGVLHRPCCTSVGLLNVLQKVRLRGPTRKRVPPCVAQRTQVGAFVASLQEPMHDPGYPTFWRSLPILSLFPG